MATTTLSVAASEEPLLMVASSCSSSVAAVTEEFNEPSRTEEQNNQTEQSSKSTSAIVTEESSHSHTTSSKSDDSSLLAVLDSSFTFYDRWHHEIHVLRAALDEKIGLLAEQSQREIERLAAHMTGQSPKRPSAASKYAVTHVGPKVPAHQRRIPRDVSPRQATQDRNTFLEEESKKDPRSATIVPFSSSADASLERVLSQLSSSQAMIPASPSGRSHATGTSDKTVPQSNLSKHKSKQPSRIRQVLSIPEESSLLNESDGGEDSHRLPSDDHRGEYRESVLSQSSEGEEEDDMYDGELEDGDLMVLQPSHHSRDDSRYSSESKSRDRRIRGLTIITSHSEFLGDDDSKPAMTSIPSLPLSSTSFPSYASKASPSPLAKSPPKPFYRFFDSIRELRMSRQHRPWYQTARDAPTDMNSPRPDAPSEAPPKEEEKTVPTETEPATSIESSGKVGSISTVDDVSLDNAVVTTSPSTISSSRSPTSTLSDLSPVMAKSNPDLVKSQPSMTELESSTIQASSGNAPSVPVVSAASVAAPPPKQKKAPPLPEIFQRRRSTERLPRRRNPKTLDVVEEKKEPEIPMGTDKFYADAMNENAVTPGVDNTTAEEVNERDATAPCLDIVVYDHERKVVPRRENTDPSVWRMEYVTDRVIQDPYSDEGTYTGILVRGKPDSHGTMVYKDGRTYSGSWKRGRWDGQGKTTFINGDSYVGDYVQDERHGVGRYEWADGRVYDGRFENDQREGQGTYSWPNGSVYCGEFHNGLRHGYGTYTYEDGSIYNGQWHNGKQHGTGECVWADGRSFRGEWLDGHAHLGIEVRADGTIRHNGEWSKDRPVRKSKSKKENQASASKELTVSKSC